VNPREIIRAANATGYRLQRPPGSDGLLMFSRDGGLVRVRVWHTTMTVSTCLDHPKRGKTQLFKRNVTPGELVRILDDPRVHIGGRYYQKEGGDCGVSNGKV